VRFDVWVEIDLSRRDARFDVAGGVENFSGNDIPELVLNEETLHCMHPVVEIVRIKLTESERRRFGKSESMSGKCVCAGHERFWISFG
jgi:hypothetical protein